MLNLDALVDMNTYNNLVKINGGSPIITKKKLLTMKAFISVILKLFRNDFESKIKKIKKGGYDSNRDLGIFDIALKYGDLNYAKNYDFPVVSTLERGIV